MRPTEIESLRAIGGAIAEQLLPEVHTAFAQEGASAAQMLIESLAAEIDTAAQDLVRDNETLRGILTRAREALPACGPSNDIQCSLVSSVDGVLSEEGDGSIAVSRLTDRNNHLRGVLADFLEYAEDVTGEPGSQASDEVRAEAYRHLRRVAVRGWSFFDVSGFRERMPAARAEIDK